MYGHKFYFQIDANCISGTDEINSSMHTFNGVFLGPIGTVIAFNTDFLRIWWGNVYTQTPTYIPLTVTISVYRTGKYNPDKR